MLRKGLLFCVSSRLISMTILPIVLFFICCSAIKMAFLPKFNCFVIFSAARTGDFAKIKILCLFFGNYPSFFAQNAFLFYNFGKKLALLAIFHAFHRRHIEHPVIFTRRKAFIINFYVETIVWHEVLLSPAVYIH